MKTFKILAMMCIILGLTTKINAQSTSSKDIDVLWSFFIDCIGENAVGTLTLHFVYHYDNEGNMTRYHGQPQGGVLVGETTGTIYHIIGVTEEGWKTSSDNGAWTDTYINNYIAVGVGKDAVRWGGKATIHTTITKDGEVTAYVDKYTTFCK
jgi:hypothetical protein